MPRARTRCDPLGHDVDPDHPVPAVLGDPGRHVADRAEAEHRDAPAVRDAGVLDGLPAGRQDVGEVDVALVGPVLGHLDVGVLRLGHAQVLRLPAGHRSVEVRVAEQRGAHALLAHLRGLALGLQILLAHVAVPAGDLEGDHDAVAGREVRDRAAHLLDDAHRLVAEHVALVHERPQDLVEVQVGPAQAGGGDADDRVRRFVDRRVGDLVDADVALAVPGECLHHGRLTRDAGGMKPSWSGL